MHITELSTHLTTLKLAGTSSESAETSCDAPAATLENEEDYRSEPDEPELAGAPLADTKCVQTLQKYGVQPCTIKEKDKLLKKNEEEERKREEADRKKKSNRGKHRKGGRPRKARKAAGSWGRIC